MSEVLAASSCIGAVVHCELNSSFASRLRCTRFKCLRVSQIVPKSRNVGARYLDPHVQNVEGLFDSYGPAVWVMTDLYLALKNKTLSLVTEFRQIRFDSASTVSSAA